MIRALVIVVAAWLLAVSLFGPDPAAAAPAASSTPSPSAPAAAIAARHDQAVVDLLLLDRRLADARSGLAQAQAGIERTELALGTRRSAVKRSTKDLRVAETRLAERVRETYVRGPVGWLDFLGESASLGTLMDRLDLLGRVLGQEAELTQDIDAARRQAVDAQAKLTALLAEQQRTADQLARQRAALQKARAAQVDLAESLGDRLAAARADARAAQARMAELNAAAKSAPETRPARTPSARGQARTAATQPTTTERAGQTSPAPTRGGRTVRAKVTAYALRGSTATGVPAGPGIIAVDPRFIPLGTRVYVPGWGEGIAADTGGAIKGNWIDVWLPSQAQALDWGIRQVTITILD